MVGFFKAFGKGVFEGFNDMVEAEDAHQKQLDLITFQNSFKDEVIEDKEYETVSYLNSDTGKYVTDNLYELPNRKDFNEGEFADEKMRLFFSSNVATPQYMENLLKTNPAKFAAMVRKGDGYSYIWHNANQKFNTVDGDTTILKGMHYPAAQPSWFKERFNQIALSKIPTDDYGLPALRIETDSGVFFQNKNVPVTDYGYESIENLYADINQLRYMTNDSRTADEILSDKEAQFFKTYKRIKPVVMSIQASCHNISLNNLFILNKEFNGVQELSQEEIAAGKVPEPVNPYFHANYNHQFEFLKMIAPSWLMKDKGSTYGKIDNPTKYIETHMGIEMKDLRGKASAASAAGITIDRLLAEFFVDGKIIFGKEGDVTVPKYGLAKVFVQLKEGLFGAGGLKDQMLNLAAKYNIEHLVTDERINTLEQAVVGAADQDALKIAERDLFYELLAYQVAAAIQGGTGGRTISDADVANIKRALGISGLSTGRLQYKRLTALRGFMKQIELLNTGYTAVGSNMKNVVAAGHMHQLILGGDIRAYTTGDFYELIDRRMGNLEQKGLVEAEDSSVTKMKNYTMTVGDKKVTFGNVQAIREYARTNNISPEETEALVLEYNEGTKDY